MGPLVYHTNWQWTFYLMALINLGQLCVRLGLPRGTDPSELSEPLTLLPHRPRR